MSCVVLLRAVNVGGHQRFQPSETAKALRPLDVVSLGAAGTFVVRGDVGQDAVRAAFAAALPFVTEPVVLEGAAVARLVDRAPFAVAPAEEGAKPFVSVLGVAPACPPPLPLERPADRPWEVRVVEVDGPFVLSWWRRLGARVLYPNEVVEKALRVPATTRGWDTFVKVRAKL